MLETANVDYSCRAGFQMVCEASHRFQKLLGNQSIGGDSEKILKRRMQGMARGDPAWGSRKGPGEDLCTWSGL